MAAKIRNQLNSSRMAAEAAGLRKVADTKQVEVDKQDQLMINTFNRANNRKHELLELIKKQKVSDGILLAYCHISSLAGLQEQLSNLEDAQTELMLLDDAESFMCPWLPPPTAPMTLLQVCDRG